MILIKNLTEQDIGRGVVYHGDVRGPQFGKLSSWNDHFVFVRFKGPNGESCKPEDISWEFSTS